MVTLAIVTYKKVVRELLVPIVAIVELGFQLVVSVMRLMDILVNVM
jgi:hypothetical protein